MSDKLYSVWGAFEVNFEGFPVDSKSDFRKIESEIKAKVGEVLKNYNGEEDCISFSREYLEFEEEEI